MNNKRNRNLNVISGIKEELIDKATGTRIRYFNGKKRQKKLIPIIAIAATVAILMSIAAMILAPMLVKQVPVYKGMTVTSADAQDIAKYDNVFKLSSLMPIDNENTEGNNGNHGSNNPNKKPIEDIVEDESSLQIVGGKVIYSAKPGEKILVVIHFDNPDQFEIMSFTLNGKKYATQMFKDGSDMENLIVEYDIAEDAEGIIDCTIDAIKYIDGTTIKDVKIGGDQTVQIGIYNKEQPTAKIENEVIGTTDVSFDVTVNDPLGLIGLTKGKAYAVLADREKVISTKEITVGEKNSVKFDGLSEETYYRYGIVAYYDAFDGQGYTAHTLYESPINLFSLTYLMNGGYNAPNNPSEYWISKTTEIENPSKPGYIFLGWTYEGQDTPKKNLTIPAGTRGDIVLKANWQNALEGMVFPVSNVERIDVGTYDSFGKKSPGLGIYAPVNSDIICAVDGIVYEIGSLDTFHSILIKAENSDIYFYYNSKGIYFDDFKAGDRIAKGTVIGKVQLRQTGLPFESVAGIGFSVYFKNEESEYLKEADPLEYFSQDLAQSILDGGIRFDYYFENYCGVNNIDQALANISKGKVSIVRGYSEDHRAIDVASERFSEGVYAIADGVITNIWNDSEYGYSVAIKCGDVTMIYQNLKNQDVEGIHIGASVLTGGLIGYIGDTSTAESGEGQLHLVFEYAPGLYIDPTK